MDRTFRLTVNAKNGSPITGLEFKDFKEGLENKTCLLEVSPGKYIFFENEEQKTDYAKAMKYFDYKK